MILRDGEVLTVTPGGEDVAVSQHGNRVGADVPTAVFGDGILHEAIGAEGVVDRAVSIEPSHPEASAVVVDGGALTSDEEFAGGQRRNRGRVSVLPTEVGEDRPA